VRADKGNRKYTDLLGACVVDGAPTFIADSRKYVTDRSAPELDLGPISCTRLKLAHRKMGCARVNVYATYTLSCRRLQSYTILLVHEYGGNVGLTIEIRY